jgi:hypothetical protein
LPSSAQLGARKKKKKKQFLIKVNFSEPFMKVKTTQLQTAVVEFFCSLALFFVE